MTNEEFLRSPQARAAGMTAAVLERRLEIWSMPEIAAKAARYDIDHGQTVALATHLWMVSIEYCTSGFLPPWPTDEPMPEGCAILLFHLKGRIELARMPFPESLTPDAGLLNHWCSLTADQRIAWLIELGTALAAHVAARS